MKVVAIRGVCIGPERHLLPLEEADLDDATAKYLVAIGAVALAAPAEPAATTDQAPKAAKAAKKGT